MKLAPQYNPNDVENRIYRFWEDNGYFTTQPDKDRKPYTIVIPPPNVTGILHMGHALNNTLQDVIVRFWRMRRHQVLWLPGTDHAGVATQAKVERAIWEQEKKTRHDLGREELLKRIWAWKEAHGDTIINQLKKLGSSCDWSRLRFTMDEGLSDAVRTVFVQLYKEGLIYRGERLVNWSCPLQTALSDDELEYEDVNTSFWHIRYPLKDNPGEGLTVATTRPETMLGDTAVAVHPEDPRYKHLIGKNVILPLLNREIPVIADEYVKRDEGSGCLKVTPAHDPNDFEIGKRHNLPLINILNPDGTLNENAGPYAGEDRLKARPRIVRDLESKGLIEKIEPLLHRVAHCYRSHDLIEPFLSRQWYVRMASFVEKARAAETSGRVRFHPQRWSRTFHQWLDTTPDWCISRQIWWGHRIPVWTCDDCGHEICELEDPKACPACNSAALTQDPDVLDTWFSSQLWPFSTLGWPAETKDLAYYYPTNLLVTDRGIIALWVARMIMMGLHFMDEVPFRDVYIHATILDRQGRRMSKSLGNGIDPVVMIQGGENMDGKHYEEGYGADAVRFTLAAMTTEGQDMKIWPERFEVGRNFANKIWNASRFCLMNLDTGSAGLAPDLQEDQLDFTDRWILTALKEAAAKATACAEDFRYCDFALTIYEFIWGQFCDWYLELIKPRLTQPDAAPVARRVLAFVLDQVLRLLHPVTPFITEAIWSHFNELLPARTLFGPLTDKAEGPLICADWPDIDGIPAFDDVNQDMTLVQEAVRGMREVRSRFHGAPYNLSPKTRLDMFVACRTDAIAQVLSSCRHILEDDRDANASIAGLGVALEKPGICAVSVRDGIIVYLPLEGIIDLKAEYARLEKERAKVKAYHDGLTRKVDNPNFRDKAPKAVVEKEIEKLKDAAAKLEELTTHMASIKPEEK